MPNIVEIIVTAKDMTEGGFRSAEGKATGLGTALTKFAAVGGAALAVVGYESIKMASKFDASMEMLSTQAGVPQSKIAGLKSGVLALASQVGFSPESLAESLYHVASNMASLGATGPQMLNVVKVAAEGARIGGADLVDVTNALTAAVASGIPGVKNYSQAMGMLNATVGAGDMKMQDLAEAFGTGAVAVVKGYGLSLKDVGAALATFGDNNIRGAHAGTLLKMTVASLAVPSKAAKQQMAELGITTTTLASDMQHGGLLAAIEDLSKRLHKAGLSAKDAGPLLTTLFTKKSGPGIAILLDQLDRFKSKYAAISEGASGFGSAWQKTLAQTSTVFAQLKGWFDALMISIGEKLLPVVKSVGQFMLQNKTAFEITAAVIAGLVAVIGLYVGIVKTITIVTEAWSAIQAILNGEMTLNPIGLIVVAIAALVIGIVEAYKHSKAFRDIVHEIGVVAKEAFHWVLTAAMDAFNWIKDHWRLLLVILTGPVGVAVDLITYYWKYIVRGAEAAVNWIRDHWRLLLVILTGPVGLAVVLIVRYWHDILRGVEDLVGWIKDGWKAVEGFLTAPVESAYNTIMGWFHDISNFIGNLPGMIQGAVNSIPGVGSIAKALGFAHGGIVGAAAGGPRGGWTMVGEYGPELVRLAPGSQVYSNAQSQGMLAGGGGGVHITLELGPSFMHAGLTRQQLEDIRYEVRTKGGGDVQRAFGRP